MSLFAWGAGNHGQLTVGLDDTPIPIQPPTKGAIQILTGGGSHSLLVVDSELHSCGSNDEGQLGFDNKTGESTDYSELHRVLAPELGKVLSVACGWSHSLALVERPSGETSIFAFGSNAFSQLGILASQSSVPSLLPAFGQSKVCKVYCGLRHSAFTAVDGSVWLFGENRFAQCGDSSLMPVTVPTRLGLPHFVKSAALGSRHTALLTDSGMVFCVGENRFGQCGVDPSLITPISRPIGPNNKDRILKDLVIEPTRVEVPTSPELCIRAGWNFTLVWTPTSEFAIHLFGRNNYGQLGLGTATPFEWKPVLLDLSKIIDSGIQQVECGSEHTLVLTKSGSLWAFGWNEHGQLGTGDEADRWKPTQVSGLGSEKITRIAAGYGFSFALSS